MTRALLAALSLLLVAARASAQAPPPAAPAPAQPAPAPAPPTPAQSTPAPAQSAPAPAKAAPIAPLPVDSDDTSGRITAASLVAPRGARRYLAISYSPLTLMLARYGGTLDFVPASHHGITLTAFYAYTRTNADSNNVFEGVGGEVGYRYYFGHDGPRGLFLGPSLLLGRYTASPPPGLGSAVSFDSWGVAADVGWQATVIDRVAVGIATGVQYTDPSRKFPVQELPAAVYANRSVMPRLNVWVGVAF